MPTINDIVIVADGEFPTHEIPLNILRKAGFIISCDGAASKLISQGIVPNIITGDMDSLDPILQEKYSSIIIKDGCQETNDLTKAFMLAVKQGGQKISIVGATGLREDHTLGNISLLYEYLLITDIPVTMWTNYGLLFAIKKGGVFKCTPGSQISVFSLDRGLRMKSKGLIYPLDDVIYDNWWKATLNESFDNSFELIFEEGRVIVFISYPKLY
jgi:thiamine pyrophosphokinase